MRTLRVALIALGAGLLVAAAVLMTNSADSVAYADGGPHGNYTATSSGCGSCHRAHTAQADKLLTVDKTQLCLSCHGATGVDLDVVDGIEHNVSAGTVQGALRGGGFTYARIGTTSAYSTTPGIAITTGITVTSAHVKGGSVNSLAPQNVMWGNGAINSGGGKSMSVALVCSDCHNPHGNGSYRILRPNPNNSGASTSITLTDQSPKDYITANYWLTYQGAQTATFPWGAANMSSWCSTCHTRYNSNDGGFSSGDTIFNYRHKSNGTNSLSAGTGSAYAGQAFTTQCLQCHVSHGSPAVMSSRLANIPWPGTTTGRGAESTLLKIDSRGTCIACHGTQPGTAPSSPDAMPAPAPAPRVAAPTTPTTPAPRVAAPTTPTIPAPGGVTMPVNPVPVAPSNRSGPSR